MQGRKTGGAIVIQEMNHRIDHAEYAFPA